jgi:PAS domain S-box-containing protein
MAVPLRVLILEDQPADAELTLYELRRAGYAPEWRRVETEAEYLAALDPALDLILADFALPQFDALRALALLGDRGMEIPFIIVSGTIGEDVAVAAMQLGAADYLIKDRLARLGTAVERALQQRQLRVDTQRANQLLEAREQRFRALIEHSSDGVALLDIDGTIRYVSPSIRRILGYAPEALTGQSGLAIVHPEDRAMLAGRLQSLVEEAGKSAPAQARVRHADGGWRWLEFVGNNQVDEPNVAAVVLNFRDITERIAADQALRRNTARLQMLADASHALAAADKNEETLLDLIVRATAEALCDRCGVALLSEDGAWLRLAALYGATPEICAQINDLLAASPVHTQQLMQQAIERAQPVLLAHVESPALRALVEPHVWPLLDQMASHSIILVPLRIDGQAIGMLYLARHRPEQPAFDGDDLRLAQDLADRAALAISNARLYAALQQSHAALEARVTERTAELVSANTRLRELNLFKDNMLAITSHDLRSPLGAIYNMAEILSEEIELSDEARHLSRNIYTTTRHLIDIVSKLLDLARLEAGKVELEPIELRSSEIAQQVLDALQTSAQAKSITTALVVEDGELTVYADWMKLSQILTNLVSNAIKFTQPGGRITVAVGPGRGGVCIRVSDTGLGIPAEALPHLFEQFRQVHTRGTAGERGSGLGLTIVRQLVELHGGEIEVTSAEQQGSTFTVYLPAAEAAVAMA